MSAPPAPADVEVVLDLHDLLDAPTTKGGFAELWKKVEPALVGRDLRTQPVHRLTNRNGTVRLEVVRVDDSVDLIRPSTRFAVVGVRETALIRRRCRLCSATGSVRYGPFECGSCGSGPAVADNRVCDAHVSILDGALTATCVEHRPSCDGCARPATFRCAGRCRSWGTPWCDRHRRPHPSDPDLDYCPNCYDAVFPRCTAEVCADVGTIWCEHVEATGRPCGRRTCPRHGSRWQVFGGERLGLGRCGTHRDLRGLDSLELLRQIVAGAARRRHERPPSLRGFAYNLRRYDAELALDYGRIAEHLRKVSAGLRNDPKVAAAVDKAWPRWEREHDRIRKDHEVGEDLVARLRQLAPQHDPRYGPQIAAAIGFADYVPPVEQAGRSRRALLFVTLPEHLHGRLKGKGRSLIRTYSDLLGAEVKIDESGAGR